MGPRFGEVISTYTRAQANDDGVLVDVGALAREVGFRFPVALTTAVRADCIAWTDEDSKAQVQQDPSARLWDVLFMAAFAIKTGDRRGDRLLYELYRIPRDGYSTKAVPVTLKLIVGAGDTGEPVMTIVPTKTRYRRSPRQLAPVCLGESGIPHCVLSSKIG